jgi:DNA-binding LacI/PurR family transcriptional regulator
MRLKDIAKKLGVSKTTVDNYIKKYDLRNGKR